MLGLISPKKEYYYIAKWINNKNRNQYSYFRFKMVSDDNTKKDTVGNISSFSGIGIWETKSMIDFKPDDIIFFRGQKYFIKDVDGNKKAEHEKENAYLYFNNNGNLTIKLSVYKAG